LKSLIPIIIIFVFLLPGCGKKGPPVPPRLKPVPAVSDLKYSIEGNILTLTWTIPKGKEKSVPDGFVVYRYKRPVSDSDCRDCPKLFQKVSDIPADNAINAPGNETKNIIYREEVKKGFVYTYKVVVYNKSGAQSRDSNNINFNF